MMNLAATKRWNLIGDLALRSGCLCWRAWKRTERATRYNTQLVSRLLEDTSLWTVTTEDGMPAEQYSLRCIAGTGSRRGLNCDLRISTLICYLPFDNGRDNICWLETVAVVTAHKISLFIGYQGPARTAGVFIG